jgi:phytoene dehydrogenase-like protein
MMPARLLVSIIFRQQRARALFAGNAAHSMLSLDKPISSAFGLIFGVLGHAVGWPIARGGSQKVADSLASYLRSLGGKIYTEKRIENLDELSAAGSIFLDVTPKQVLNIAGSRLPPRFQKQLRKYRYGPGVFKIDYALDSPVPWTARECLRAGTVHIGGDFEEIAASEKSVSRGDVPERPFVIASQPSLFDSTRAPEGKHTLWAYCHVPNDSTFDMTRRIETQIERFAPGFKDRILARHVMTPGDLELHNANNIGGDIAGGILDIRQFITRPTRRLNPYSTPIKGLYLCSASTPPGWGVHGMCGYNAARSALLAGKAH